MTPILHFILGGNMTEEQWGNLGKTIKDFYTPKVPFPFEAVFYRYTDDVYNLIKAKQPSGPIVLVGHSFGGCKATQVATQFNKERTIDHLVLFDPVEITAWNKVNTNGFALSTNVAEAVCFTRNSSATPPCSGKIASGNNFRNNSYEGGHGDAVWNISNINMIALALSGKNFLAPVVPTPAIKQISKVIVYYTDGTSAEL